MNPQPKSTLAPIYPEIEQIKAALENVEPRGDNHWTASCPLPENHKNGDSKPSLSVTNENGKALVHCFAGCDQNAVWAALRSRIKNGVSSTAHKSDVRKFEATGADVESMAAALFENAECIAYIESRGVSTEVATKLKWGYRPSRLRGLDTDLEPTLWIPHHVESDLVGIKGRNIKGEKAFTQIPASSIDGLYGADHLDGFSDEVLVLEGPEDAALAMSYGFNATAIIATGSKLSQRDITALKQFKRIFLIGDQDLPGKIAMDKLQGKLPAEQVIRVRLPGYKDIGDLWKADRTGFKDQLRQLLRFAQTCRENFDLDDLMTESEVRERQKDITPYVVDEIIPLSAITMFFGEEKSGKSLLVTYLLKCIANGNKAFGILPVSKRTVLYLDRENSSDEIAGMTEHFKDIGSQPIRYRTRTTGCPEPDDPALIRFCEKHHPVLVFDSLTKFLKGADPFHPGEMSDLFDKLLNLCAAGATVIIIHHATKGDGETYANSHQIGANVSRGFAVISEDRPKLHRLRLEPKLCRGAEPSSFNLIAFPVISEHGRFGLADGVQTDVDLVVAWVSEHKPNGCTREDIKRGMKGKTSRKVNAIRDALTAGRLTENEGLLAVPSLGNAEKKIKPFPVAGTLGNVDEQDPVMSQSFQ